MRQINLTEYKESEKHLSENELSALRQVKKDLGLTIQPIGHGAYAIGASSIVGAKEAENLAVFVRPKIKIGRLFSLAMHARHPVGFEGNFDFPEAEELPDWLALALAHEAKKAFARGLLHGYVEREEALQTARGRIRFDEQIRRRFGLPLPVEVRYDEFTDDVLPNRLVKAAARGLSRMPLLLPDARRGLRQVAAMLDGVSLCAYPPNNVPEVKFDRLNRHYENVVNLARLALMHFEYGANKDEGEDEDEDDRSVRALGFTMDMNKVFQEFVTVALREQLGRSADEFRSDKRLAGHLAEKDPTKRNRIALYPDLSWWEGKPDERCVFVGDVKYKRIRKDARVPNADLYQMLAYATALGLPGGLLIYAKDDETERDAPLGEYRVLNTCKTLEVVELDLSGDLEDVLGRVGEIAKKVRALRREAEAARLAA